MQDILFVTNRITGADLGGECTSDPPHPGRKSLGSLGYSDHGSKIRQVLKSSPFTLDAGFLIPSWIGIVEYPACHIHYATDIQCSYVI